MKIDKQLLQGYENIRYVHYADSQSLPNTVSFDELPEREICGVLKSSHHKDGKLIQTYTEQENNIGVVAATRLGKTTSYVIPTIISYAKQKKKRGMIISDPKGEIYRQTSQLLRDEGYNVKLLNFRDYLHSECWNPLTPIYRKYKKIDAVSDEVSLVHCEKGVRNFFRGKIYELQSELDADIQRAKDLLLAEVANDVDNIAIMLISIENQRDPFWEQASQNLLKAFLWAMLEDSDEDSINPVTEETFSFNTIWAVINSFNDGDGHSYNDNGYFTSRGKNSRALSLAKNTLIENARGTRTSILSVFFTKLAVFKDNAIKLITCCNSFEMDELVQAPTAVFIDYRDELKVHYEVISLFVQDAYRFLIEKANSNLDGKLAAPFYFILDEFGNFPKIMGIETTISACAGRNIFFMLIIQSYAQLNCVYGADVAEIIRDNLNVHIFFGSNNPSTLEAFSNECGKYTRISPLSAINGRSAEIDNYQIETIPLIPVSALSHFTAGECVITEANCGYVMYSKLERYYLCDEFKDLKISYEKDYVCAINPFDKKYAYEVVIRRKTPFDY